MYKTEPVILAF